VAACRAARVPTLGFIDGPANIAFRFRGRGDGALAFAPDSVLVPTERLRTQLTAAGYPKARAFVTTHPHFARLAAERRRLAAVGRDALRGRLFPAAPRGRPVLAFLAERSDGLDPTAFQRGPDYTLAGRGGDDRRTAIVLAEVLDALQTAEPRPFIVLRLHPKDDPRNYADFRDEIDQLSRDEPALEVVYAADAVVGLTTILLSEAAALGRPVLSVVPRALEREWLLSPPQGELVCVWERGNLRPALTAILQSNP
jgi:hypothetical protein